MTMTRYSTVTGYLRSSIERELAVLQRRPALVGADELARLGALAFDGPDGDVMQCAVDNIAQTAALQAAGALPATRAAEDADIASLAAGIPADLVQPLRGYADAHAALIVKREATVGGTRSAVTRATDSPPPAVYLGVWKADAEYERGHMVTLNGVLWHAEADRVTGRPGTSSSWRLMHKSMEPARR